MKNILIKFKNWLYLVFKIIKKFVVLVYKIKSILYFIPFVLLISVSQNLSARSQLEFYFSSKAGGPVLENNQLYYQFRHGGLIKNKSKEKNTITNIGLVVWANNKKDSALRDGFGPSLMIDNRTGKEIKLPMVIEGREAVDVDIFNKFIVQGTSDEQLVFAVKPVVLGSDFTIPKYDYQLIFTDINDNEFDEKGILVNRDVINMNWTLENYCGDVHYKFWPCLKQKAKITDSKFMFEIKRFFIGLAWKALVMLFTK